MANKRNMTGNNQGKSIHIGQELQPFSSLVMYNRPTMYSVHIFVNCDYPSNNIDDTTIAT